MNKGKLLLGVGSDHGWGIALDSAGRIVVVGETESSDFPTVNAYDASYGGGNCDSGPCDDVFVTRLSADGSSILYSTYLGDSKDDEGLALAIGPGDLIYITGSTNSRKFPTINAYDASYGGGNCGSNPCTDAFVIQIDPAASGGASLLYSTFLGGNEGERGYAIQVNGSGQVYLTGYTYSNDFPTRNPLQASLAGYTDAFLAKLDPAAGGSASLLFSTYLGGEMGDEGHGIALDNSGEAVIVGETESADFPLANAYDATHGGGICPDGHPCEDVFVTRIAADGSLMSYSTFVGGTDSDIGTGVAVDEADNLFITGFTYSEDFPVVDAIQGTKGADGCGTAPCPDAFVAKLDASGSVLVYSTYLGGSDGDYGRGIALDGSGAAYAIGYTFSSDFPVTPGALDIVFGGAGERDAFLAKISEAAPPPETELNYNWHYEYDGLARLVSACSDWGAATSTCLGDSFEYTYDGAGNLLSFSRWSGSVVETVNFVYNQANQIVCLDGNANGVCGDAGDVPYSYDAYGNLTSDATKTYAYDSENRLISVIDGATTTTYTYNGDGDRMSQTIDVVTTSYVLDTATPLTMVLAETTGTETIYYLHGLDLVAQNDGVSTEYFGYDGLGSVRQVLDSSGSVLFAQVFDPYGNPYANVGIDSTSWGFTGEMEDGNGLIFLRARYYDPMQGHFLQRDPWHGDENKPMSFNLWLYVSGNPVNFRDLSGKIPTWGDIESRNQVYSCNCGFIDFSHASSSYASSIYELLDQYQKQFKHNHEEYRQDVFAISPSASAIGIGKQSITAVVRKSFMDSEIGRDGIAHSIYRDLMEKVENAQGSAKLWFTHYSFEDLTSDEIGFYLAYKFGKRVDARYNDNAWNDLAEICDFSKDREQAKRDTEKVWNALGGNWFFVRNILKTPQVKNWGAPLLFKTECIGGMCKNVQGGWPRVFSIMPLVTDHYSGNGPWWLYTKEHDGELVESNYPRFYFLLRK